MRKKIALGIIIAVTSLFLIYRFLGLKGYFKIYQISTTGCSPAINPGDRIIASNLLAAKKNDLIVFLRNDSILGISYFASRLLAREGDTIEMINGLVSINNENIDGSLRLKHSYFLTNDQLRKYENIINNEPLDVIPITEDLFLAHIEDVLIDKIDKNIKPRDYSSSSQKSNGATLFKPSWNIDNFGPYIIPANTFFVLGDNRHNSRDSRSYGPINKHHYIGKVLNKK